MTAADKDTVLIECSLNVHTAAVAYMTHCHQRQCALLTQMRPPIRILTEDCKECIILPSLLELHIPLHVQSDDYMSNFTIVNDEKYCLPVLCECTNNKSIR